MFMGVASTPAKGSHSFLGSHDWWCLGSLLLAWVAAALVVNPIGDFPLNDDWVYGNVVRSILANGDFRFSQLSHANLLFQAYWGALFTAFHGFSFTALRVSTLVLGIAGVWGLYGLAREVKAPPVMAMAIAGALLVNPLYLGLSYTFMTDVPFTALVVLAFYFFSRRLRTGSLADEVMAFVLAFLALTIRQYGLIFFFSLCLGRLFVDRLGVSAVLRAILLFAGALLFQLGFRSWLLSTGRMPTDFDPIKKAISPDLGQIFSAAPLFVLAKLSLYLGLFSLPFLLLLFGQLFRSLGPRVRALVLVLWTLVFAVLWPRLDSIALPQIPNVLNYYGLGPLTLRDTFLLNQNLPERTWVVDIFWFASSLFGLFGALLILTILVRRLPRYARHLSTLPSCLFMVKNGLAVNIALPVALASGVCLYVLMLTVFGASAIEDVLLFDRYLLPVYPLLMVLVWSLRPRSPAFRIEPVSLLLAALLMLLFGVMSVAASHDYLAWNRARWQALNDLMVVDRVSPRRIDGGYEFNGWYNYSANYRSDPKRSYWWVDSDEFIVASGKLDGYHEVKRFPFHRFLPFNGGKIVVLRKNV